MENSTLKTRYGGNKKQRDETLIDYGVEAAKRGDDPIEAMRTRRKEDAFRAALIRNGYLTRGRAGR